MNKRDSIGPDVMGEFVRRSRAAGASWVSLSVLERVERLRLLSREILARKNEIANLISAENGKARVESVAHEIATSLANLDYLCRVAPRVLAPKRQHLKWSPDRRAMLYRRPFGVVLVISPWNVPLAIPLGAVMAALIAGNSVILKPSEITPKVGDLLFGLLRCCRLPESLVQVVQGDGVVGAGLIAAKPDKVVFTGSVSVGRKVMAAAARHPIPVTLELGGIDAMVVREDANLELAASAACWGATFNGGQVCASVERVLVHDSIVDPFSELLADKLARITKSADLGRITMTAQREVYDRHIADARERGLEFIQGGAYRDAEHLEPTLIRGAGVLDSKVYREESFGPIVALASFNSDSDAIAMHNDTPFGLTASIFSQDRKKSLQMAEQLRTGLVSINEVAATLHGHPEVPWGGIGASGFGRSHGEEGLLGNTWVQVIDENRLPGLEFKRPWWYPYDSTQMDFVDQLTEAIGSDSRRERVKALLRAGRSMLRLSVRKPRL